MASDGSVLMVEPASIPLPASPHTSIHSKATTNSLVSVRLSEPESTSSRSSEIELVDVPEVAISNEETTSAGDHDDNEDDAASVHSDETLEAENEPALIRDSVSELATQSSLADEIDFEKETDGAVFEPEPPTAEDNHRASVISEITDSVTEFPAFGVARSASSSSHTSTDSAQVDWKELDETEKAEQRDEASDESTAFLLARLEQENNALAHNPRAGYQSRVRKESRPPSMHVLKKMVQSPTETQRRFSVLPDPPPMTELEFWAALVKDYAQTAQRLPTLTANKIKSGVPPPLRGVVWMSMVGGARDPDLSDDYEKLIHESSPYENMIGKDIGRSFPGVEMFKEAGGEGQQMLGRVLKAFSLYDKDIGYCQGLGFLVGPLLMQMPDKDAFCVLVRLMENYNLRSCYLPDLSGLHLRIYQFQQLLNLHMPELAAHLASLQVEAAYLSQWFLSFFAVTCPLPMLFRIYDVILAEGASETIMRVSLSLMRRNEAKLMVQTEFEEVMQLLLSRALWEPYSFDADDLVNDFTGWTGLVTREALQKLETTFNAAPKDDTIVKQAFFPSVTAAASGFLGRLWTTKPSSSTLAPGGHGHSKSQSIAAKRVSSKPSIATITSVDISSEGDGSNNGSVGTTTTAATSVTRESSAPEATGLHSKSPSTVLGATTHQDQDKGLHGQIEDLLTAMTEMQREQSLLTTQLQKEREERDDDHKLFHTLISHIKVNPSSSKQSLPATPKHKRQITAPAPASPSALSPSTAALTEELAEIVKRVEDRMTHHKDLRRSSMLETKQRLRDSLMRSKDQLSTETSRARELSRQLDSQEQESSVLREQLREARTRISEGFQEKQKLERQLQDYKSQRKQSLVWTDLERPSLWRSDTGADSPTRMSVSSNNTTTSSSPNTPHTPSTSGGLRELKLGARARDSKRESMAAAGSPTPPATVTKSSHAAKSSTNSSLSAPRSNVPQRGSSLATQSILSTKDHAPAAEDHMLLELVNAKTAEAVARQELEQVKSEMQQLRRFIAGGGPGTPPISTSSSTSALGDLKGSDNALKLTTGTEAADKAKEETTPKSAKAPANNSSISSIGGFWSWGRKASQPVKKAEEKKPAEEEVKEEAAKDSSVDQTASGEQEQAKA